MYMHKYIPIYDSIHSLLAPFLPIFNAYADPGRNGSLSPI